MQIPIIHGLCLCVHKQGEAAGYLPIVAVRTSTLTIHAALFQEPGANISVYGAPPPPPPPALEHLRYENKGKQNSADAKKKEDGKGTQ